MDASLEPFVVRGRVALVTGGNRGIGAGVVRTLAAAGANVLINERRPGAADALARSIESDGGRCAVVCADVENPAAADMLVNAALERWARLDILVNNAGAWGSGPSEELPLQEWERILRLNLTAPFLLCQSAARVMLPQRAGCVINISSIMARTAVPGRAAYSAAKAGLEQLTAVLACEWADRGIRVNAVAPGFVNTRHPESPETGPDYTSADIEQRTPLGRWGLVEDVARAVLYLASPAANWVTGQTLYVDGGWTAYGGWRRPVSACPRSDQG